MQKLAMIFVMALFAISCNNEQKNKEIKEDVKDRLERVGEKIDTGMDKMKDKLQTIKDTLKSKIHRATAPDSQP